MNPPVYKYGKREHIEALTRRGQILVGTLYDFRDRERHSSAMIADPLEGIKVVTECVFELRPETHAPLTRRAFGVPPGTPTPTMIIRNNLMRLQHRTENLWIYCVSGTLMSTTAMKAVMDPSYDAVAEIRNPEVLHELVCDELDRRHPLRNTWGVWVTYRNREGPYADDDGIDAAVIKPPIFARQDELRMIFAPATPITEKNILLEVPPLVSCCRMLRDDEIPKA